MPAALLPQSRRLILREMSEADYPALCAMLQDAAVMYAYEGPFNEAESRAWLARRLQGYVREGFDLWAVTLRDDGRMIGQCGITRQHWKGRTVLELGYLLQKTHQHQGFASEAAAATRDYAFSTLRAREVFAFIRAGNQPSMRVAERLGMRLRGACTKYYRGKDMPHAVFSVLRAG